MNKDTVVGILGAVILVAAMVGIFYYEGTQAPAATGAPGGSAGGGASAGTLNATSAGPTAQGGGGTLGTPDPPVRLNITQANLTAVDFTMTWTDPQTGPVQFTLKVTGPQNQTATGSGGTGLKVHVPVNGTTGVGSWTLSATSTDNTPGGVCGASGGLPVANPACAEPTWKVETALAYTRAG